MSDNRFEPIHKAHAIVEMVLFFEFIPSLGENVERLLPLCSELKGDFPSNELLQVIEFNTPEGSPSFQVNPAPKAGAFELRRFKPDGSSFEWLIRVTPSSISIHCLEYTRWIHIWEKVNGYASEIAGKLAGIKVNIAGIGLKYIDQFLFYGNLEDYDASLLLKPDSNLLHPHAFNSKTRWHCHSGWFEETEEFGEILSQMNIDSLINNVDGSSRNTIIIDHTFMRRTQIEGDLIEYLSPGKTGEEARSKLAQWMHDANKKLLSDLLVESVRNRISLYTD